MQCRVWRGVSRDSTRMFVLYDCNNRYSWGNNLVVGCYFCCCVVLPKGQPAVSLRVLRTETTMIQSVIILLFTKSKVTRTADLIVIHFKCAGRDRGARSLLYTLSVLWNSIRGATPYFRPCHHQIRVLIPSSELAIHKLCLSHSLSVLWLHFIVPSRWAGGDSQWQII